MFQSLSTKSLVVVVGCCILGERQNLGRGLPNGDLPGCDTQAEGLFMVPYVSLEPKMAQGKWVLQTISDH